jgi:hypothetical protein
MVSPSHNALVFVLPVPAESAFSGDAYSSALNEKSPMPKVLSTEKYGTKGELTRGNFCATM